MMEENNIDSESHASDIKPCLKSMFLGRVPRLCNAENRAA
jgi:hypothetical protein